MTEKYREIVIASDPRNLAKARKFVETIAKQWGFNDEQIFDIKVATGEAVSNAIEHGSPEGSSNKIKIEAKFIDNKLELNIIDEGIFKKDVKVDSPDPRHRGRGIPFMLALMDKVTINELSSGTSVKLEKRKT